MGVDKVWPPKWPPSGPPKWIPYFRAFLKNEVYTVMEEFMEFLGASVERLVLLEANRGRL